MLYNKAKKRIRYKNDCVSCTYFDKETKKCKGIGQNCYEYDIITGTLIDPVTNLPITLKGEEK